MRLQQHSKGLAHAQVIYGFTDSPSSTSLHLGVFWAGSFSPLTTGACGFDSAGGEVLLRPDTPKTALCLHTHLVWILCIPYGSLASR